MFIMFVWASYAIIACTTKILMSKKVDFECIFNAFMLIISCFAIIIVLLRKEQLDAVANVEIEVRFTHAATSAATAAAAA